MRYLYIALIIICGVILGLAIGMDWLSGYELVLFIAFFPVIVILGLLLIKRNEEDKIKEENRKKDCMSRWNKYE